MHDPRYRAGPPQRGFSLFDFMINLCVAGVLYTVALTLVNDYLFEVSNPALIAQIVDRGKEQPDNLVTQAIVGLIRFAHWTYPFMVPWGGIACGGVIVAFVGLIVLNLGFEYIDFVFGAVGSALLTFAILGAGMMKLVSSDLGFLSGALGLTLIVVGLFMNLSSQD